MNPRIASLFNRFIPDRTLANRDSFTAGTINDLPAHRQDPYNALGNPFRDLTASAVASHFDAGLRGDWTMAQWFMTHIEQRDPDVIALFKRRVGAIKRMDWNIKVAAAAKDANADPVMAQIATQQQAVLQEYYDGVQNIREVVGHLASATFRAYAHVAIKPDGTMEPLDQLWFLRDGMYGDWYWNPKAAIQSARSMGPASRLDSSRFLIREDDHSIIWWAILKALYSTHNMRWWTAFVETVGKQGTVIIGPAGIAADAGRLAKFEAAASRISQGYSGWLPDGTRVEYPNTSRGLAPYNELMQWLTEKMVLAGTGGLLSMLAMPQGIGSSASDVHDAAFDMIAEAEAAEISEIMQRKVDRAVLDAAGFQGTKAMAYFELSSRKAQNTAGAINEIAQLKAAGFDVTPEEASERTGYKLTVTPPPAPIPFAQGAEQQLASRAAPVPVIANSAASAAFAESIGVPEAWISPIAKMIDDLIAKAGNSAIGNDELERLLQEAIARLPELFDEMGVDQLAKAMAAATEKAALDGIRSAAK